MTIVKPFGIQDAEGKNKDTLAQMEQQMGFVPNIFGTMARFPQVLNPFTDIFVSIMKDQKITPRQREIANLLASSLNGCEYCTAHHKKMSLFAGLKGDEIMTLSKCEMPSSLDPKEKIVFEYTKALTENAENIPEEVYSELKNNFSEEQIVILTTIVCFINYFNKFSGALKVEVEEVMK